MTQVIHARERIGKLSEKVEERLGKLSEVESHGRESKGHNQR